MLPVPATKGTELVDLKLGGRILLVLLSRIVAPLAIYAGEKDVDAH
jgi:hypothetical protein